MAIEIRTMKMPGGAAGNPVGYVEIFAGDGADAEQSKEWIMARVKLDDTNVTDFAMLQIIALRKMRDLLTSESDRLSNLYRASERSGR